MKHPGAGILFTDGNKILLLRRAGDCDHVGTWCIPGGKLKDGESALAGARRESKEEAGQVHGNQIAVFREENGFTVFMFKTAPFQVKLSHEHDKQAWVPLAEINSLPLHPQFKKNLPHYLQMIRKKFGAFREWLALNP